MGEVKSSKLSPNYNKYLVAINNMITNSLWNEWDENDFPNKNLLRELFQKCSGGKIVKMIKWILTVEEKTEMVKDELKSFFQYQALESFENYMKIKHDSIKMEVNNNNLESENFKVPLPKGLKISKLVLTFVTYCLNIVIRYTRQSSN